MMSPLLWVLLILALFVLLGGFTVAKSILWLLVVIAIIVAVVSYVGNRTL